MKLPNLLLLGAVLSLPMLSVAQINVSSNYLQYGNIVLGSSESQQVTLTATNPGTTINSITIGGSGYSFTGPALPFTFSTCQSSVVLTITDKPPRAGTFTGTLVITPSTGSPVYINETGNGVAPPQVTLNWQAPASSQDPVASYHVYRDGASLVSGITATNFLDTAVASGSAHSYYVTSADANGVESVPSNTVQVQVP